MISIECPYCKYIFDRIDSEYLKEHQYLPYEYTLNIPLVGEYSIKTIYDIVTMCDFFINSIYSLSFQKQFLTTYNSYVYFSNQNYNNLPNAPKKKTINSIKWDIFKKAYLCNLFTIEPTFLSGICDYNKATPRYLKFHEATVDIEQDYINKALSEDDYDLLFTWLYNYLLLINSFCKNNSPLDLVYEKPDIAKLREWFEKNNRFKDKHDIVTNIKILDSNKTISFNENEAFKYYRSVEEICSNISSYWRLCSWNYTQCILLLTYYYAEYLGLYS